LYDHKYIPSPLDAAFSKALDQIEIHDPANSAALRERLLGIAIEYWQVRRSVEQPPPEWYRKNVEPVRTAIFEVSKSLKERRGLYWLDHRVQREMNRPLLKRPGLPGVSVQELLDQLAGVCDKELRQRGKSGRPKNRPVIATARKAAELWHEVNGKSIPVSLEIKSDEHWKFGPSKLAFIFPGPLFVQTVLQGVNPRLDVTEIRTALRHVLSPKSKRKSKGKRK